MKILVTGSEGRIGREIVKRLLDENYEIRTLDVKGRPASEWEHIPADLRDISTVRRAAQGMDAIIHTGAIPSDRDEGTELMAINVMGTWNVLQAALESQVPRVVNFSSINAQGSVKGHWPTEYLPIDDDYPHHPTTPYQLSKHLGEEMCRSFSERHGLITLCLRPTWVIGAEIYARLAEFDRMNRQWAYEYWGYVDVRDVVDATLRCLLVDHVKHESMLLAANDTSVDVPSAQLVDEWFPKTPWKVDRNSYFANQPNRTLIDSARARLVLGWQPMHSWRHWQAQA